MRPARRTGGAAIASRRRRWLTCCALLGCLLSQAGCIGRRCSPGQILAEDGNCVVVPEAGSATDGAGDSRPTDNHAESRPTDNHADLANNLNESCQESGPASKDCHGIATFCVVLPGNSVGYCTLQDCTLNPDNCPKGFSCLDLSQYVAGLPLVCISTG